MRPWSLAPAGAGKLTFRIDPDKPTATILPTSNS
jgi:hypothetical protein